MTHYRHLAALHNYTANYLPSMHTTALSVFHADHINSFFFFKHKGKTFLFLLRLLPYKCGLNKVIVQLAMEKGHTFLNLKKRVTDTSYHTAKWFSQLKNKTSLSQTAYSEQCLPFLKLFKT